MDAEIEKFCKSLENIAEVCGGGDSCEDCVMFDACGDGDEWLCDLFEKKAKKLREKYDSNR